MPEKNTKAKRLSGSNTDSVSDDAARRDSARKALDLRVPWAWLKSGISDLHTCRYVSLIYGACFVLMGLGIDRAHTGNPAVALALAAGFLFAGPFLAIGIYELSRQIQEREPRDMVLSLFSWCRNPGAIGRFALFLSVVMVVWLWLSVTLFDKVAQGFSVTSVLLYVAWVALAVLVFMASVISIPMLLDQAVSAQQTIKASVNFCLTNWNVLALWAVMIAVIIGASLLLGYWLLLVTGPVVGHASWHAYQDSLLSDANSRSENHPE